MGRSSPIKQEKDKIKCVQCEHFKAPTEFYMSDLPIYKNGKLPICKSCIRKTLNLTEKTDPFDKKFIEGFKEFLVTINRPLIESEYQSAISEIKTGKLRRSMTSLFGLYNKNLLLNYKGVTLKDSKSIIESQNKSSSTNKQHTSIFNSDFKVTPEIVEKWGYGYSDEEYMAFIDKYGKLKNNYQEKTAMHTEALLTYIRYRVKEEMATAKGEVKDAKAWGDLATRAASDAKINPSQLSKSDLSDGLDTFGQLVRSVEQAVDIIPILPKFKERPQDKVDFTLLCYINYIRDLKGLPLAKYPDIYQFYEQRKKEYEERDANL
jgi:hypothetical protein